MFEDVYGRYQRRFLTEEEAAEELGVCPRTLRRYVNRYKEEGLDGLIDKRLEQTSNRTAPVDEVMALQEDYRDGYEGWSVRHYFNRRYQPNGGGRSYSWVKNRLQQAGLVKRGKMRGTHRKRRERRPKPGMMLHQDGSTHEWVPGKRWDLIATLDDATGEHYSLFFCEQEGTRSSLQAMREVIAAKGLCESLYTDRGSHYWLTPKEGGKVDKTRPTQFGTAMARLGIEMIPGYSPQARGRSERAFGTHQNRLVKELAAAGITDMDAANRYIRENYLPAFNEEFSKPPAEEGSAFVPCPDLDQLDDILCERHERVVGGDNCVQFRGMILQIPANRHRCHYVRVRVTVLVRLDGTIAIFRGPRKLAVYDADGKEIVDNLAKEAA